MADKADKKRKNFLTAGQPIAVNKRARYDYALETPIEAGIQLTGSEVKSLRSGHASIAEAYVGEKGGELFLLNATIEDYKMANALATHAPKRPRKLLLHKKEIDRFIGAIKREGYTIIPTRLYFNGRNTAKVEIALGKGKKMYDKRATEKARDWSRNKRSLLREK
jgi:SsrA-binding protein